MARFSFSILLLVIGFSCLSSLIVLWLQLGWSMDFGQGGGGPAVAEPLSARLVGRALRRSDLPPLVRFALEDIEALLLTRERYAAGDGADGDQRPPPLFDGLVDSLLRVVWAEKRRLAIEVDGFVRGNRREVYAKIVSAPSVRLICETGFNFGYSSLLFLATNPGARVLSFDLMERELAHKHAGLALLHALFPGRLVVVPGNSSRTLVPFLNRVGRSQPALDRLFGRFDPAVHTGLGTFFAELDGYSPPAPEQATVAHGGPPPGLCDAIHVDGGHFGDEPHFELTSMARFGSCAGSVVFMDDMGTCPYCEAAQRAWSAAVRAGLLSQRACYDTTINGSLAAGIDKGHQFCVGSLNNCKNKQAF